jgi:hypothetical protein
VSEIKPKSDWVTKDKWIIRCMAAENTVRAQDIELRQARGRVMMFEAQAKIAEERAAKLGARESKLVNAASVLVVIAAVLAFALLSFLIGGAQ